MDGRGKDKGIKGPKIMKKEKKTVTVCQVDLFRCPSGPLLQAMN